MKTLATLIEALINSRPLGKAVPLSEDVIKELAIACALDQSGSRVGSSYFKVGR